MVEEIKDPPKSKTEDSGKVEQGWQIGKWAPWFIGGGALSFLALCSLVLFILVMLSVGLNAYLAWQLSGFEVVIVRPIPTAVAADAGNAGDALVIIATATPESSPADAPGQTLTEPTNTPVVIPTEPTNTPAAVVQVVTATPSPTITIIDLDIPERRPLSEAAPTSPQTGTAAPAANAPPLSSSKITPEAPSAAAETASDTASDELSLSLNNTQRAAGTSTNSYKLIPLEGQRDSRPAEEHGDLNLKLRDPQASQAEARLVDYTGYDDANAPKLSDRFAPNFVATYTVHDWDWNCNCKGQLKNEGFLVGIKTTPGEPIYIPTKKQDIWQGKYYAMVLYASEDSLTFVYAREGTVANAYSVHYQGLQVDPNLLALYRESTGNELPGLSLDTPVGTASDELIVAIRDKGTFMDTRSRKDWWD